MNNYITPPQPTLLNPPKATGEISDLLALMARLRSDCPWDIKQTNKSLIPYAIEEAYEVAEAIQQDEIDKANGIYDDNDIKNELGDLLLQVIFHCQLYAEQGRFGFSDVIETLQNKLIRRHPHVFEKEQLSSAEAVKKRWDEIKAQENIEKSSRGKKVSKLDKVKIGSPLMQAQALQKYASKLGFDWDSLSGAIDKLDEEILELKEILPIENEKISEKHRHDIEKELGDCIFGLVNIARKLDINAEFAALTCTHKFRSRFLFIEQELAKINTKLEDAKLEEMDKLWEIAKTKEKSDDY